MKIEEFKKALKGIIREEVKKIVAEEVSKAMGKVLVEMVREIKSSDKPSLYEDVPSLPTKKVIPETEEIYTRNPKLNNVLTETARSARNFPKPDMSGLAELMGGGFDKIGAGEDMGIVEPPKTPYSNMDFLKQMVGNSGTPNVPMAPATPSVLDYQDELPDALQGVFKKDFRNTMKKLDDIKKNGGSGLINPSQFLIG